MAISFEPSLAGSTQRQGGFFYVQCSQFVANRAVAVFVGLPRPFCRNRGCRSRRCCPPSGSNGCLPSTAICSAERVYSTATVVWSFLGQVLRDGKEASCQAAVARIVVHQQQTGGAVPTSDTGDYCRARAKLSEDALARVDRRSGWRSRAASEVRLALERPARQARRRLHVHHARHAGEPSRVSATHRAKTGLGLSHRPCRGDSFAGHGLHVAIWRWALTPARKPAKPPCCAACWNPLSEGDLLVLDRYYCSFLMIALLVRTQDRRLHAVAPAPASRLSQRPAARARRSSDRLDQAVAAGVDG